VALPGDAAGPHRGAGTSAGGPTPAVLYNHLRVVSDPRRRDLCLDSGRYPEAEVHYRKALATDEGTGKLAMVAFDSQRLCHALIVPSRRDEAAAVLEHCAEIETRIVHEPLVRPGKDPGTT